MKASRRDYEAIALLIYNSTINNYATRRLFAERMAHILSQSNPAFDGDKFVQACVTHTK